MTVTGERMWTPILAAKPCLIVEGCPCCHDGVARPMTEVGLVNLVLAEHRSEMTGMSGAVSAVVVEFLDAVGPANLESATAAGVVPAA